MRISGGFAAALFGVAMTLFAWYGPWAWPAWPAFTVLHLFFGGGFDELSYGARAVVVVLLIVVNVGFWGLIVYGAVFSLRRAATRP